MPKRLPARLRSTIERGEPMLYVEIKEGKRWKPIAKRGPGERATSVRTATWYRGRRDCDGGVKAAASWWEAS